MGASCQSAPAQNGGLPANAGEVDDAVQTDVPGEDADRGESSQDSDSDESSLEVTEDTGDQVLFMGHEVMECYRSELQTLVRHFPHIHISCLQSYVSPDIHDFDALPPVTKL